MKTNLGVPFSSFVIAFAYFVVFNIFDLSSTILALKLGLSEANFALIYLTSTFGLSFADTILLVKSLFFACAGGLIVLGVATKNMQIKKTILFTIILFTVVFALVSINNFISIFSVILV